MRDSAWCGWLQGGDNSIKAPMPVRVAGVAVIQGILDSRVGLSPETEMHYKSRPLAAGWNRPILGSHHRLGRQHIARPDINPHPTVSPEGRQCAGKRT